MNIITLDFETYYANDFTLSKLTTEEYIRDPRFQVIGVGVKVNDGTTVWKTGEEVGPYLKSLDWENSAFLAHNTLFDGAIAAWHFGVKPFAYLDTLSMARAIHGVDVGGSLAFLAEKYNIGVKGTEVIDAKNKRLEDFDKESLARYGSYCINDVNLTYDLFNILGAEFPLEELKLIDMTLRMFIEPVLEVDDALLVDRLQEVQQEKLELLSALKTKLECETEEEVRKKLSSNKQFAALLEELGIKVPMKKSPATGKDTFALAKNDTGFIELLEHDDPFIQQLCTVRLGTKSTLEESRITRFLDIGARNKGKLPIPLKYYGAHTGRWSGSDKVNFQNLPSRDKKKKTLKNSVVAPDGHLIINCDSSQIEARVLAWWAGQDDVVSQFTNGEDVYSIFASKIYNREISKAYPVERFVGKTCIAEGTLVLCDSGWKPIEKVSILDKVWDGEEWVCHQGLLKNGLKETLNLCGIWLTPDHQVWSGTKWLEAQSIKQESNTLSQALVFAAENLPLQGMYEEKKAESKASLLNVIVGWMNTQWILITSKLLKVQDVTCALNKRLVKNVTGFILKPFQMTPTELDFLIDLQLQSLAATQNLVNTTSTTDRGGFRSTKDGEKTNQSFLNMFRRWKDGIIQSFKWTVLTTIKDMNQVTLDLYRRVKTLRINEESLSLRPVYDILNSGSKNRFTILTDNGPLIVHNCVLGLGFGTGAAKLQHTLATQPPGAILSEIECKNIVNLYRDVNHKIVELWYKCDEVLADLASWPTNKQPYYLGEHKCVLVTPEGIKLPNGLYIRYPQLKWDTSEARGKFKYKSRKGWESTWGGSVVENVVQALARIVVGTQMVDISERHKIALTVHDAAVPVVPEKDIDEAMQFVVECMSKAPDWAVGLPVACEAKYNRSYGEC